MEKLRNQIDTKKIVGIDVIPHKLVKMASNFLAPMLTTAISSSIKSSMFPENEKVATVVSLDKGKPEKNDISIFRPVSIIKIIFKVL